ncbi:hypothetical protein BJ322DRAFT_1066780 [Thelephora terrestris]|uniref:F-box domain-containing protein n=1 Tax=Thelephora terrestris TaxID=56493 RepID=A0A9P6L5L3_9AGAM|nr:hypothetical protein BJ322DRAFT_1066780 [Thelephora terrestris]
MDARTYPGRGLSILQLAFALNEELKHTASSPFITLEQVSQLENDISATLATIREWRNTFSHINRLPFDILSLIPTHLVSQKDRLRASFVCRHWRRTFLQRAELWSELVLSKGEDYVKTLLGRAKGSQLVVNVGRSGYREVPTSTMSLLSPHTNQIRDIGFANHGWADIQRFIDNNPGPFPLLDTLTFNLAPHGLHPSDLEVMVPPSTRLFSTAVNLKNFRFYTTSAWTPPLSHFVFPNLVVFDYKVRPWEPFCALQLLDFLETSPMLQRLKINVMERTSLDGIPQERVVVLPNVKDIDITLTYIHPGYEIATHLSCPSVASMALKIDENIDTMIWEGIFPTPDLWNAIIRQYTRSPVEELTLSINIVTCTLTLRTSDATVIELCLVVKTWGVDTNRARREVFAEAINTILDYPQLANIKRVSICHNYDSLDTTPTTHISNGAGRLFKSLGPLDELTICRCDVQPYSHFFLSTLEGHPEEPAVFPPIKKLTILHPVCESDEAFTATVLGLARSRNALGVPFESLLVRAGGLPAEFEAELRPWVGNVEYCYEELDEELDDEY